MTLELSLGGLNTGKCKGKDKHERNFITGSSLWPIFGGFTLCLILLVINICILHLEDSNTATTTGLETTTTTGLVAAIEPFLEASDIQETEYYNSQCRLTIEENVQCIFECSDIADDPGKVAGDFLEALKYKVRCLSRKLKILRSNFPQKKLTKGWLKADVNLMTLHLERCEISEIEDDAFEGLERSLAKLYLINVKITELRKATISKLTLLKELYLNELQYLTKLEDGILSDFVQFETLQMNGFTNLASVLPSIVGTPIRSIAIVDFRFNYLPILAADFFRGLSKCQSFYFANSNLRYIEPNTFFFRKGNRKTQIYLNNNRLQTLSEDALNIDFFDQIYLANNSWVCNCSLAWLARSMRKTPYKFQGNVFCSHPKYLRGKLLKNLYLDDCPASTSTPTTITTTSQSSTTDSTTIHDKTTTVQPTSEWTTITDSGPQTISPQTTSTAPTTIITITPSSSITTTQWTSTEVSIPDNITPSYGKCPKIYFTEKGQKHPDETYKIEDHKEGKLQVHTGIYVGGWKMYLKLEESNGFSCWYRNETPGTFELKLEPGKLYLMCITAFEKSEINPNNCVAHSMLQISALQPWLLNKDAPFVIGGCVVGVFLISLIIAGMVYATVQHFPTLIRGNKRVIHVQYYQRSSARVLVMPKGYKGEFPGSKKPVKASTSLSSSLETPRSSTTTYVSVNEPTAEEILAWRLQRLMERSKQSPVINDGDQSGSSTPPPPVPPYPQERISTVSLRVESLDSGYTSAA